MIGCLTQHSSAALNIATTDSLFLKPNFYDAAYLEWLQAFEQVLVTGYTQTPV